MLTIVGITMSIVFGLIGIWWAGSGKQSPGLVASVCIACVLVGFGLVYQENVVDLTIKGVGKIRDAAEYADYEVKRISDIRDKVEEQKLDIRKIGAEVAAASEAPLEQCRELYARITPSLKPRCIEYIWNRSDFPEKDRMRFLIDVLRDDPSLNAVEQAGRLLSAAAGLDYKPLAVADFLKWWEENKGKAE